MRPFTLKFTVKKVATFEAQIHWIISGAI